MSKQTANGVRDEILTVCELARVLKCHPTSVYRLAHTGRIRGFRLGGSWRFMLSKVLEGLDEPTHVR